MIRHLAIATLAAAALGGCVTDYAYRDGVGDYYYGRPSVEYYDSGYGAPYGSVYGYPGGGWNGGLSIRYGYGGYGGYGYPYGYGYYGGGYPYYPPYWHRRHHRPHHPDRPPPSSDGPRRVTGGNLRPSMGRRDTPNSPIYALPREGRQPMRPPSSVDRSWRGGGEVGQPNMSRPLPQVIRQPGGDRGNMVERRSSPPPVIRQAPPSRAPSLPERELDRKRER